jgi:hypothetical protein
MTSDNRRLTERVRAVAEEFRRRAGQDPAFVAAYHADPVGALQALGMPEIGIVDALRETGCTEDEVSGFLAGRLDMLGALGPGQVGVFDPGALMECGLTCLFTEINLNDAM